MKKWAFRTYERTILCCSSTRHRRFVDDLVKVMALPAGARVRLRYGKDVCDPKVRELGEQGEIPWPRISAIITHVSIEATGTKFLPLRKADLVEVQNIGSVTVLDLEVRDFVEPPDCADINSEFARIATRPLPKWDPTKDKPLGDFCQFFGQPPILHAGADTMAWERVALELLGAISNSHAAFPYLFNIAVTKNRSRKSISMKEGVLVAPAIAGLDLHVRTLSTRTTFDSIIHAPVGFLTAMVDHPDCRLVSAAKLPIDTTRNLLNWRLSTSVGLRPAFGSLTLSANRRGVVREDVASVDAAVQACLALDDERWMNSPRSLYSRHPEDLVSDITVEIPITVGRTWIRYIAICLIAAVVAANAFDIGESGEVSQYAWYKSVGIFIAVVFALVLGLKPQSGN